MHVQKIKQEKFQTILGGIICNYNIDYIIWQRKHNLLDDV